MSQGVYDVGPHFKDAFVISTYFFCNIYFGFVHKRILNVTARKWASTIFGLVAFFGYLGLNLNYYCITIIFIVGNCVLIKLSGPRFCHVVSTIVPMLCLTIIRAVILRRVFSDLFLFNALLMYITTKLVYLGCDIHSSHVNKKNDDYINPSFVDILHYSFSYIGICGGVFNRYRTYDDFVNRRFYTNIDDLKLFVKCTISYAAFYSYLKHYNDIWNIGYIVSAEFEEAGFMYKLMRAAFEVHGFIIMVIIMMMCVQLNCEVLSFGAYPVDCMNTPGHGPTINYRKYADSNINLIGLRHDFNTIVSFNVVDFFTCPWLDEFMRIWNRSHQYWISNTVRLHFGNVWGFKHARMVATFLYSGIWHSIYPGIYIAFLWEICAILILDVYKRFYLKFLNDSSIKSRMYLFMMILIRACLFMFAMLFNILSTWDNVSRFMTQINFFPILLYLILLIGSFFMRKYV